VACWCGCICLCITIHSIGRALQNIPICLPRLVLGCSCYARGCSWLRLWGLVALCAVLLARVRPRTRGFDPSARRPLVWWVVARPFGIVPWQDSFSRFLSAIWDKIHPNGQTNGQTNGLVGVFVSLNFQAHLHLYAQRLNISL